MPSNMPTPLAAQAFEDPLGALSNQLGRMVDEVFERGYVRFSTTKTWRPAVNVLELADRYAICVELAGMRREEIDVEVKEQRVIVRGLRADPVLPDAASPACVHLMEIDAGPFHRQIELPDDADVNRIQAEYREGLLWILAPKRA